MDGIPVDSPTLNREDRDYLAVLESVQIYECKICGAAVSDWNLHILWHKVNQIDK